MKTTVFKGCIAALLLISSIACHRDKSESPVLPVSDNRSETAPPTNIELLNAEFVAFNQRIIDLNVDVDKLKTDYEL